MSGKQRTKPSRPADSSADSAHGALSEGKVDGDEAAERFPGRGAPVVDGNDFRPLLACVKSLRKAMSRTGSPGAYFKPPRITQADRLSQLDPSTGEQPRVDKSEEVRKWEAECAKDRARKAKWMKNRTVSRGNVQPLNIGPLEINDCPIQLGLLRLACQVGQTRCHCWPSCWRWIC